MQPSYQSGFYAPGRGVAKHPELWRGCVGAWNPGLGNTGLSLRDWSGNQNNGVLTNGPTWGVSDGRQALDCDGVDDYVDTALDPSFIQNTLVFSISGWINRADTSRRRILGSVLTQSEKGFFLMVENGVGFGNNALRLVITRSNPGIFLEYRSPDAAISTGWTHVGITGLGGTSVAMYVNGTAVAVSTHHSGTWVAPTGASTRTLNLIRSNAASTSIPFYGQIDDTRIYNRALSPNETRTLAQRPGIAYELAPRKTYFIQAATSTSQFYDVLSPLIFAGTN